MSVKILPFRFPGIDGVGCAFQLRTDAGTDVSGGNISFTVGEDADAVAQHRRDLLGACGVERWAELHQVHRDDIIYEPDAVSPEDTPQVDADGMATRQKGLALLIKTADCQPVLIAHKSGRYVAALHVGWRGDRLLFPYTGLTRFCEHYGIKPQDCSAVRGPSLGPARAEFTHFASEWGWFFKKYFDFATSTVDLWAMTRDQLMAAGMPRRNIYGIDLCTRTNTQLLFSYRASHACGRQGSLIWIELRQFLPKAETA